MPRRNLASRSGPGGNDMFSKKTLFEIVKALDFQTHDQINRFGIEFEIEHVISGTYVKEKETSIVRHLVSNPEARGPNGANLTIEVVEYALRHYFRPDSFAKDHPELALSLERDGFELTSKGVRRKLPGLIPIAEQEDELISLLDEFGFDVAKGHYQLAVTAHGRGEWASANAQLRSFVEEFFNKTVELVRPSQQAPGKDPKVALANAGFFRKEYNEYLSNGTGFVEGFWKRLHPAGSHPGLSEKSDSTFRLHLVILVAHHFLVRIASNYGSQNQYKTS
jgi:hypothetical protein